MGQFRAPTATYVLIIEDEPVLMMSMADYVEEAGMVPIEANSVDQAIHILETRTDIRIVFTDLDMRGSTAGMHLAVAIRDRWPPIELLMTSSWTRDADSLPERGVYVGKPFDQSKVVNALRLFIK